MRIRLDVVMAHDTRQLETVPADLVAWERETGKTVTSWSETAPSFSDVAFLAYRCDTREATPRPSFDDWLESSGVLDITLTQVEQPNPTQQEAGAG